MSRPETHTAGWFDGLRRMRDSLFSLARSRAELFAVELQEEKLRLLTLLVLAAVGLVLGAIGLLLALGTLAIWLWETAGYAGLTGLALGTLFASGCLLLTVRKRIRRGPRPFAGTLSEFRKDYECLRGN